MNKLLIFTLIAITLSMGLTPAFANHGSDVVHVQAIPGEAISDNWGITKLNDCNNHPERHSQQTSISLYHGTYQDDIRMVYNAGLCMNQLKDFNRAEWSVVYLPNNHQDLTRQLTFTGTSTLYNDARSYDIPRIQPNDIVFIIIDFYYN